MDNILREYLYEVFKTEKYRKAASPYKEAMGHSGFEMTHLTARGKVLVHISLHENLPHGEKDFDRHGVSRDVRVALIMGNAEKVRYLSLWETVNFIKSEAMFSFPESFFDSLDWEERELPQSGAKEKEALAV